MQISLVNSSVQPGHFYAQKQHILIMPIKKLYYLGSIYFYVENNYRYILNIYGKNNLLKTFFGKMHLDNKGEQTKTE